MDATLLKNLKHWCLDNFGEITWKWVVILNEMIFAMSAKGEMKMEEFYDLVASVSSELDSQDENKIEWHEDIFRGLSSLGYCEFDFGASKVYMCEPVFVLLPGDGLPRAALTGARIPKLISRIKKAVRSTKGKARLIEIRHTPRSKIPPLLCIEADRAETISEISASCNIKVDLGDPIAWRLVLLSASLQDIMESLSPTDREWSDQPLKVFDYKSLVFSSTFAQEDTMLTEYIDRKVHKRYYWYWSKSGASEIDKDWGRYLILSERHVNVLLYDRHNQLLAAPGTVPIPALLSRALALCSGTAPQIGKSGESAIAGIPPDQHVYLFSGVEEEIAESVAKRLGQTLQYHRIDAGKELCNID